MDKERFACVYAWILWLGPSDSHDLENPLLYLLYSADCPLSFGEGHKQGSHVLVRDKEVSEGAWTARTVFVAQQGLAV